MGPVFAIVYPAPQAVATMVALGNLASLQLQGGVLRDTAWRQVLPLAAVAWLMIPVGAYVLLSLDSDVMRRGISGLILVMVLVLMTGWRYPGRPNLAGTVGVGAVSGVINGATGVGGPPVVLYLLAGPNPAATNRANLITYYTFLNFGTLVSLFVSGVFGWETLWRTLLLWPVQIASLAVGTWLFRRASDQIYRRIAMLTLLGVALFGLLYTR